MSWSSAAHATHRSARPPRGRLLLGDAGTRNAGATVTVDPPAATAAEDPADVEPSVQEADKQPPVVDLSSVCSYE